MKDARIELIDYTLDNEDNPDFALRLIEGLSDKKEQKRLAKKFMSVYELEGDSDE